MKQQALRASMAVLAVVLVVLAVWTAWPATDVDPNAIGYTSVCPFAPVSTLMLAGGAIAAWTSRSRFR